MHALQSLKGAAAKVDAATPSSPSSKRLFKSTTLDSPPAASAMRKSTTTPLKLVTQQLNTRAKSASRSQQLKISISPLTLASPGSPRKRYKYVKHLLFR